MIYYALIIHNLISTHEECTNKRNKSTYETNYITTRHIKKSSQNKATQGQIDKTSDFSKKQNELNEQQNVKTSDNTQS